MAAVRPAVRVGDPRVQRAGEGFEDLERVVDAGSRDLAKQPRDAGLDGSGGRPGQAACGRFDAQPRAAPVVGVAAAFEEALPFEPAEDAGERARMQPGDLGQFAGRDLRKSLDNSEHEPLRAGDAGTGRHAFRRRFEGMFGGPETAHEVEDRIERPGALLLGACHLRSIYRRVRSFAMQLNGLSTN